MTTDMLELIAKIRGTYEGPVNVWDIRNAAADALEAAERENAALHELLDEAKEYVCAVDSYSAMELYKFIKDAIDKRKSLAGEKP